MELLELACGKVNQLDSPGICMCCARSNCVCVGYAARNLFVMWAHASTWAPKALSNTGITAVHEDTKVEPGSYLTERELCSSSADLAYVYTHGMHIAT